MKAVVHTGRDNKHRTCPVCHQILDAFTGISVHGEKEEEDIRPEPGSFSVCAYCATIIVFTVENFRVATQEDFDAMPPAMLHTLQEFSAFAYKNKPNAQRNQS
jgi:hypothetical protein